MNHSRCQIPLPRPRRHHQWPHRMSQPSARWPSRPYSAVTPSRPYSAVIAAAPARLASNSSRRAGNRVEQGHGQTEQAVSAPSPNKARQQTVSPKVAAAPFADRSRPDKGVYRRAGNRVDQGQGQTEQAVSAPSPNKARQQTVPPKVAAAPFADRSLPDKGVQRRPTFRMLMKNPNVATLCLVSMHRKHLTRKLRITQFSKVRKKLYCATMSKIFTQPRKISCCDAKQVFTQGRDNCKCHFEKGQFKMGSVISESVTKNLIYYAHHGRVSNSFGQKQASTAGLGLEPNVHNVGTFSYTSSVVNQHGCEGPRLNTNDVGLAKGFKKESCKDPKSYASLNQGLNQGVIGCRKSRTVQVQPSNAHLNQAEPSSRVASITGLNSLYSTAKRALRSLNTLGIASSKDGHPGRNFNDLNASFDPNYLKNHKGHESNHHECNDCHTKIHYGRKGTTSRTASSTGPNPLDFDPNAPSHQSAKDFQSTDTNTANLLLDTSLQRHPNQKVHQGRPRRTLCPDSSIGCKHHNLDVHQGRASSRLGSGPGSYPTNGPNQNIISIVVTNPDMTQIMYLIDSGLIDPDNILKDDELVYKHLNEHSNSGDCTSIEESGDTNNPYAGFGYRYIIDMNLSNETFCTKTDPENSRGSDAKDPHANLDPTDPNGHRRGYTQTVHQRRIRHRKNSNQDALIGNKISDTKFLKQTKPFEIQLHVVSKVLHKINKGMHRKHLTKKLRMTQFSKVREKLYCATTPKIFTKPRKTSCCDAKHVFTQGNENSLCHNFSTNAKVCKPDLHFTTATAATRDKEFNPDEPMGNRVSNLDSFKETQPVKVHDKTKPNPELNTNHQKDCIVSIIRANSRKLSSPSLRLDVDAPKKANPELDQNEQKRHTVSIIKLTDRNLSRLNLGNSAEDFQSTETNTANLLLDTSLQRHPNQKVHQGRSRRTPCLTSSIGCKVYTVDVQQGGTKPRISHKSDATPRWSRGKPNGHKTSGLNPKDHDPKCPKKFDIFNVLDTKENILDHVDNKGDVLDPSNIKKVRQKNMYHPKIDKVCHNFTNFVKKPRHRLSAR